MIKGEYLPGLSLSRLLGKAGMNWGNEEWQVKQVMKKEKKKKKESLPHLKASEERNEKNFKKDGEENVTQRLKNTNTLF